MAKSKKVAAKKVTKKAAKKVVKKVAKKTGAKKAVKKIAQKAARKTPSKTITEEEIGKAAFLLFLKRQETGAPGTSEGDWLEAERLLTR